jgi:hypothetical protein
MEQSTDTPQKIYNNRAIWIGTFLGGPLAAGYLIAENYKAFNESDKVKKTWFYTIISTVLVLGIAFSIPDSAKIPNQLLPFIYTSIAYYLIQYLQGEKIAAYISAGGRLFSWGRTVIVGIIGLAITFIPIFVFIMLSDAETTTKTFGIMKHEIAFDKTNISETEVNTIADALTKTTFFDEAITKYVYAKKVNSDFEIYISCNKSIVNNLVAQEPFIELRNQLQTLFPNNKIIFNLIIDDLDNIVKRLE